MDLSSPFRAGPKHWADIQEWVEANSNASTDHCLWELKQRIEELEALQVEQNSSNHFCFEALVRRIEALETGENARQQDEDIERALEPSCTTSLLERVQTAIHDVEFPHSIDDARAVVRVIARWLDEAPLDVYSSDRAVIVNALLDQANHTFQEDYK
jgi:hypothetical protein